MYLAVKLFDYINYYTLPVYFLHGIIHRRDISDCGFYLAEKLPEEHYKHVFDLNQGKIIRLNVVLPLAPDTVSLLFFIPPFDGIQSQRLKVNHRTQVQFNRATRRETTFAVSRFFLRNPPFLSYK